MLRKLEVLRKWYGTDSPNEAFHQSREDWEHLQEPPREQCIKVPWPYYAPADCLPAPLPTLEDIEKERGTDNDFTKWKLGLGDGFVFRVNDVFAVKFFPTRQIRRVSELEYSDREDYVLNDSL